MRVCRRTGRYALGAWALPLILATPGCDRERPRAREEGEAEVVLFSDERIGEFRIYLDLAAMAELAREPRDNVRGSVAHGGRRYEDVAIRFKGHRTMRSWHDKPSFKLDFGKYDKGRRFLGLSGVILNNMVEDPTMLREALASRILAGLGVPAARAGFAEVFVNDELFGLYTVAEPMDERFLSREFGDGTGVLYEGEYGCDVCRADAWGLQLEQGDDPQRRALLELADAVEGAPSALLFGADSPLDVEALLRSLAGSAAVADFDGYRHAHNYRLHRSQRNGKWYLLPSGLDRVLKQDLDPFDSEGVLARRCYGDAACRLRYVKALRKAADRLDQLAPRRTLKKLERLIAEAAARDPRKPYDAARRDKELAKTRRFLARRADALRAVTACWDGRRELDRDGDGHGCLDCADDDPQIHPGAVETCDGIDNDCNGVADDAPSCSCVVETIDDRAYHLCDLAVTWSEAARLCRGKGLYLARPHDAAASKRLGERSNELREDAWWIGLDDREREGRFVWHGADSSGLRYWSKGEPDDYRCGQNCVALKERGRGRWRDLHCASRLPFICSPP